MLKHWVKQAAVQTLKVAEIIQKSYRSLTVVK